MLTIVDEGYVLQVTKIASTIDDIHAFLVTLVHGYSAFYREQQWLKVPHIRSKQPQNYQIILLQTAKLIKIAIFFIPTVTIKLNN